MSWSILFWIVTFPLSDYYIEGNQGSQDIISFWSLGHKRSIIISSVSLLLVTMKPRGGETYAKAGKMENYRGRITVFILTTLYSFFAPCILKYYNRSFSCQSLFLRALLRDQRLFNSFYRDTGIYYKFLYLGLHGGNQAKRCTPASKTINVKTL